LTPFQLERSLGTNEKLTAVLPKLLSVSVPERTQAWQPYRKLKKVRDSTVHLKSVDHYVRGKLDRESLYHRLLDRDPLEFPRTATRMIRHDCRQSPDRWLEAAEERLTKVGA